MAVYVDDMQARYDRRLEQCGRPGRYETVGGAGGLAADGVAEGVGPDSNEGETSVGVPETLLGEYWFTARAVDDRGEASEWAVPFRFIATGDQDTGPFIDPDSFVSGGGCGACAGSVSPMEQPAAWWLVALMPVALVWRRRRS